MIRASCAGEELYEPGDDSLPVVEQQASLSVDSPGEYRFTLARSHPLCGRVALMDKRREVVLEQDGVEVFRGRAVSASEAWDGSVEYVCEGERAYLNDVLLPEYSAGRGGVPNTADGLFAWYVARYNEAVDESLRFHVGVNEGWALEPDGWLWRSSGKRPSVWEEIKSKLVDDLGGFVRVRRENGVRWIDWLADGTTVSAQHIEFGVNLTDFARGEDGSEAFTRVTPWSRIEYDEPAAEGEERPDTLGIEGVPDRPLEEGYEKVGRSVVNVAEERRRGAVERQLECSGVTNPETLVANALRKLKNARFGESMTVSAVDLNRVDPSVRPIRVGDFVRVTSEPHGYDAYLLCREMSLSPGDAGAVYSLGATYDSLTGRQAARLAELNAGIGVGYERADAAAGAAQQARQAAGHASQKAEQASQKAEQAQQDAGQASQKAEQAVADAQQAQQDAAAAKNLTTLVHEDADGVTVGKVDGSGAWAGVRARLGADGRLAVLDAAGSELSAFGADLIELGKNSPDARILMCGGRAAIKSTGSRGVYRQMSMAGEWTSLQGTRNAGVYASNGEIGLGNKSAHVYAGYRDVTAGGDMVAQLYASGGKNFAQVYVDPSQGVVLAGMGDGAILTVGGSKMAMSDAAAVLAGKASTVLLADGVTLTRNPRGCVSLSVVGAAFPALSQWGTHTLATVPDGYRPLVQTATMGMYSTATGEVLGTLAANTDGSVVFQAYRACDAGSVVACLGWCV